MSEIPPPAPQPDMQSVSKQPEAATRSPIPAEIQQRYGWTGGRKQEDIEADDTLRQASITFDNSIRAAVVRASLDALEHGREVTEDEKNKILLQEAQTFVKAHPDLASQLADTNVYLKRAIEEKRREEEMRKSQQSQEGSQAAQDKAVTSEEAQKQTQQSGQETITPPPAPEQQGQPQAGETETPAVTQPQTQQEAQDTTVPTEQHSEAADTSNEGQPKEQPSQETAKSDENLATPPPPSGNLEAAPAAQGDGATLDTDTTGHDAGYGRPEGEIETPTPPEAAPIEQRPEQELKDAFTQMPGESDEAFAKTVTRFFRSYLRRPKYSYI